MESVASVLMKSLVAGLVLVVLGLVLLWLVKLVAPKTDLNTLTAQAVSLFVLGAALSLIGDGAAHYKM